MTGYVLDDTILAAFAQGNNDVANVIAGLDAAQTRMAVPVVTMAAAEATLSVEQCGLLNAVIDNLEYVRLDALADTQVVTELSRTIYCFTDSTHDAAAAHAATVAKRHDWWILTMDKRRWDMVTRELPWTVELIEFTETSTVRVFPPSEG